MISPGVRFDECGGQREDIISNEMIVDISISGWKMKTPGIKSFLQRRIIPNFGIIVGTFYANVKCKNEIHVSACYTDISPLH